MPTNIDDFFDELSMAWIDVRKLYVKACQILGGIKHNDHKKGEGKRSRSRSRSRSRDRKPSKKGSGEKEEVEEKTKKTPRNLS